MKKFTVLSALVMSFFTFAAQQGEVVFFSNTGEQFFVLMNGNFQNTYPSSNVSTNAWGNNVYNFKIQSVTNQFTFDRSIMVKPNRRLTYKIVRNYGGYHFILQSDQPINGYYGNGYDYPYDQGQVNYQGCNHQNQQGNGHHHGHGNPHHQGGHNDQGVYYTGYGGNMYNVMSDQEFIRLKQAIRNESFSDDQLRVAKLAAQNKRMKVSQIKEVARLFTFSKPQLDFAKAAYNNCVDKQNYYEVMDVFTFSSDKRKLEEFINQQ